MSSDCVSCAFEVTFLRRHIAKYLGHETDERTSPYLFLSAVKPESREFMPPGSFFSHKFKKELLKRFTKMAVY